MSIIQPFLRRIRALAKVNNPAFFSPKRSEELSVMDYSGGLNTNDDPSLVKDNQITGGQNMLVEQGRAKKRPGMTIYGDFLGLTTGILGGFNFVNKAGTQEQLVVYDTGVYRYVAGTWTALTSVTMTTGLPCDGAWFPMTDKFYIINGTDGVVAYTSGAGGVQTDANFKKGKYIEHFESRLIVAGVSTQENYIWFTDAGLDTFSANNYFTVEGQVTGIKGLQNRLLIFTKKTVNRVQNIIWDEMIANGRPDSVQRLPTEFGSIYDRTIVLANNLVYFLGQSPDNKVHLYVTDGFEVQVISDDIAPTLDGLAAGQLQYACAGFDGKYYRLSVAEGGQTTNNIEILYDVRKKVFMPVQRRLTNNRADFSCYFTSETSGQWDIYAGTQSRGLVYKLNQQDYDETIEESYATAGTISYPIDANPVKRSAQSFQMSQYLKSQTFNLKDVYVRLKKLSGTTTELTVRIETDNNGSPSGTLVHANATTTIAAFTSTSYAYKKAAFTAFGIKGSTTYWIVIRHTTEGAGNSKYLWSGDGCSPSYAYGNAALYTLTTSSASVTFNPDAHPETTSVDGYVYQTSTSLSWDDLHNGAGSGFNDESTTIQVVGLINN